MKQINKRLLTNTIQSIIRNVEELSNYYLNSSQMVRSKIIRNLEESYVYECNSAKRTITIEEYINDIETTIGWEFVLPDEELVS